MIAVFTAVINLIFYNGSLFSTQAPRAKKIYCIESHTQINKNPSSKQMKFNVVVRYLGQEESCLTLVLQDGKWTCWFLPLVASWCLNLFLQDMKRILLFSNGSFPRSE